MTAVARSNLVRIPFFTTHRAPSRLQTARKAPRNPPLSQIELPVCRVRDAAYLLLENEVTWITLYSSGAPMSVRTAVLAERDLPVNSFNSGGLGT